MIKSISQTTFIFLFVLLSSCSIIRTELSNNKVAPEGMIAYRLPTALIKIKETVKVAVSKDSRGVVTDGKIIEIAYEPSLSMVADNNSLFTIKQSSNWFSKDDVDVKVTSQGLLQSANVVSEDRTSNIIEALAKAPSIILSQQPTETGVQSVVSSKTTTEIVTYIKEFIISQEKLDEEQKWHLVYDDVANRSVEAGFKFEILNPAKKCATDSIVIDCNNIKIIHTDSSNESLNSYSGLFSRPLKNVIYQINPAQSTGLNSLTTSINTLMLPDLDRIIRTPITRSTFVKKEYSISFADGVLISNAIKKPSQVEGFVTIPINIAKAIVSIPAEIISFKVNIQTKKAALEAANLKLQEAELNNKNLLLKSQIDAQKDVLTSESEKVKSQVDRLKAEIDLLNQKIEYEKKIGSLESQIKEFKKT